MLGLMQDRPLLISSLIEHAATFHPDTEIVTRTIEGPIHRSNYAAIRRRAKRVAHALLGLGIGLSDRVGTLAWNTSEDYAWPSFDERLASSLCYTSGTTGNPKGVLYSHRSTVLHSLIQISADAQAMSPAECILLIVSMFHANAWGTPYSAAMAGTKLVLPGQRLDGQSVYELMRDEGVTASQGVPTVWLMFLEFLAAHPEIDVRKLALKRVGSGGSALPRHILERFERDYGIAAWQGWGMTETSPLCVVGRPLPKHADLAYEEQVGVKLKQGRGIWGVELKLVDGEGRVVPRDGETPGHVHVRGPWIASGYFKGEGGQVLDAEGYLPTGDIATLDADGYLQLVDRAKDVIKSGGEWISSIELENAASGHPAVAEAAVIGVPHAKWQERPLLIVVRRTGADLSRDEMLEYLKPKLAKWWLPDDVTFVGELPHTATGKLDKKLLRQQFRDFELSA